MCHEKYKTREQARQSIFEYIEVFFNRVEEAQFVRLRQPQCVRGGRELNTSLLSVACPPFVAKVRKQ